jgi:hypothetical protein
LISWLKEQSAYRKVREVHLMKYQGLLETDPKLENIRDKEERRFFLKENLTNEK